MHDDDAAVAAVVAAPDGLGTGSGSAMAVLAARSAAAVAVIVFMVSRNVLQWAGSMQQNAGFLGLALENGCVWQG
jgi:hypothetical protein